MVSSQCSYKQDGLKMGLCCLICEDSEILSEISGTLTEKPIVLTFTQYISKYLTSLIEIVDSNTIILMSKFSKYFEGQGACPGPPYHARSRARCLLIKPSCLPLETILTGLSEYYSVQRILRTIKCFSKTSPQLNITDNYCNKLYQT